MPPYLLHVLPNKGFTILHECFVLWYDSGFMPKHWLSSKTFCLFKGQRKWQDPDRWRRIAMSNSVYRLSMRWVYSNSKLYPMVSPLLHP